MVTKIIDYFIPVDKIGVQTDIRNERIFITVVLISTLFNLLAINTALGIGIHAIAYMLLFNAIFSI